MMQCDWIRNIESGDVAQWVRSWVQSSDLQNIDVYMYVYICICIHIEKTKSRKFADGLVIRYKEKNTTD